MDSDVEISPPRLGAGLAAGLLLGRRGASRPVATSGLNWKEMYTWRSMSVVEGSYVILPVELDALICPGFHSSKIETQR